MKTLIRNIKNAVWYDDVEIQVRNATSNAEGGVTAKQLLELRETALNPQKYPTLFAMLWKRITHYKHHRHIEKALYVLIYLVRLKPPSKEVQRRLIDDILQPSQFTDLRLLANLRERAAFPTLSSIRKQAADLLEWLMYMRQLDASTLEPLGNGEEFDLPDPRGDDDDDGNGHLGDGIALGNNTGGQFYQSGNQPNQDHHPQPHHPMYRQPSNDIFDLFTQGLNDQENNNQNNTNLNHGNGYGDFDHHKPSSIGQSPFDFDPFDNEDGATPVAQAPMNQNQLRRTKICAFCDYENDEDVEVCINCGCEFGDFPTDFQWDALDDKFLDLNDPSLREGVDFTTCPKCGTRNPIGSNFCTGCGCDLCSHNHDNAHGHGHGHAPSDMVPCPRCTYHNEPGAVVCTMCGHGLTTGNVGGGAFSGSLRSNTTAEKECRGWACAWCSTLNNLARDKCAQCQKDKLASNKANSVKYQMSIMKHKNKNNTDGETFVWQCTCYCVNERGAYFCRVCGLEHHHKLQSNDIALLTTNPGGLHEVRTQQKLQEKKQDEVRKQQQYDNPVDLRVAMAGMTQMSSINTAIKQQPQPQPQQPQQQVHAPALTSPSSNTSVRRGGRGQSQQQVQPQQQQPQPQPMHHDPFSLTPATSYGFNADTHDPFASPSPLHISPQQPTQQLQLQPQQSIQQLQPQPQPFHEEKSPFDDDDDDDIFASLVSDNKQVQESIEQQERLEEMRKEQEREMRRIQRQQQEMQQQQQQQQQPQPQQQHQQPQQFAHDPFTQPHLPQQPADPVFSPTPVSPASSSSHSHLQSPHHGLTSPQQPQQQQSPRGDDYSRLQEEHEREILRMKQEFELKMALMKQEQDQAMKSHPQQHAPRSPQTKPQSASSTDVAFDDFFGDIVPSTTSEVKSSPSTTSEPSKSLNSSTQQDDIFSMAARKVSPFDALNAESDFLNSFLISEPEGVKQQPQQQQQQQRAVSPPPSTTTLASPGLDIFALATDPSPNTAISDTATTTSSPPLSIVSAGSGVSPAPTAAGSGRVSIGGAQVSQETNTMTHRERVLAEIISTETTYLDTLMVLKSAFLEPLRDNAVSMRIPLQSLSVLLSSIDPLILVHQNFLVALEKATYHNTAAMMNAFIQLVSTFNVYKDYVANYQKTLEIIEQLSSSNDQFAKFVQSLSTHPGIAGRQLSTLYITPVQRLPRYVLLLKEVKSVYNKTIKKANDLVSDPQAVLALQEQYNQLPPQYRSKDDEELLAMALDPLLIQQLSDTIPLIDRAIDIMSNCATDVNEYQKLVEGQHLLLAISQKLGRKHQQLNLQHPTRTLIKDYNQDYGLKQEKYAKTRDVRTVLCNDAIFWTNPDGNEYKGGMNLIHTAFKSNLMAQPMFNEEYGLSFEYSQHTKVDKSDDPDSMVLPAPTPSVQYFIDFRCSQHCFNPDHQFNRRIQQALQNQQNSNVSSYYSALSKDVLLSSRPVSASLGTGIPTEVKPNEHEKYDPKVLSSLAVGRSHLSPYFRLVFPTQAALEAFTTQLVDAITTAKENSRVSSVARREQTRRQSVASSSVPIRPSSTISVAPSPAPNPITSSPGVPAGSLSRASSTHTPATAPSLPSPSHGRPSSPTPPTFPPTAAAAAAASTTTTPGQPPSASTANTLPSTPAQFLPPQPTGGVISRRASTTANPLAYNPASAPVFSFKPAAAPAPAPAPAPTQAPTSPPTAPTPPTAPPSFKPPPAATSSTTPAAPPSFKPPPQFKPPAAQTTSTTASPAIPLPTPPPQPQHQLPTPPPAATPAPATSNTLGTGGLIRLAPAPSQQLPTQTPDTFPSQSAYQQHLR